MTCRELSEFLMAYVSKELPPDQRQVFDEHLHACADCRTYLQSYEDTVKLGEAVFQHAGDRVPAEVPEQLVRAILAARRKRG